MTDTKNNTSMSHLCFLTINIINMAHHIMQLNMDKYLFHDLSQKLLIEFLSIIQVDLTVNKKNPRELILLKKLKMLFQNYKVNSKSLTDWISWWLMEKIKNMHIRNSGYELLIYFIFKIEEMKLIIQKFGSYINNNQI